MSSVSRAQALLLSHPDVLGSYIKDNATDQLLPRIPKLMVRGDSLQVTAVDTLGGASFITSGGNANEDATTYDAAARKFELRRMATKVQVSGDIAQNVSMINDVFEQQIQAKMVSMWNVIGDKLIYGDNADPDPAGLQTLADEHTSGAISPIAGAGTPLTLPDLDHMIELVRPWDGGQPRMFVMNRGQYRKLTGLMHASGFGGSFDPDPVLGRRMLHYMGVTVLVSDHITDTEGTGNDETSIYLVHLGTREGDAQFGGFVWFYNQDTGAGIRVDGPHRTSAQADLLYADLEINIGFASLSTNSVLRLKELQP